MQRCQRKRHLVIWAVLAVVLPAAPGRDVFHAGAGARGAGDLPCGVEHQPGIECFC